MWGYRYLVIFSDPHLVSVSANHRDPGAGREGSSRVELQTNHRQSFHSHEEGPTRYIDTIRKWKQPAEDYSRGLLHDCSNFADGSFAALLQSCGDGDSTMETITHLLLGWELAVTKKFSQSYSLLIVLVAIFIVGLWHLSSATRQLSADTSPIAIVS